MTSRFPFSSPFTRAPKVETVEENSNSESFESPKAESFKPEELELRSEKRVIGPADPTDPGGIKMNAENRPGMDHVPTEEPDPAREASTPPPLEFSQESDDKDEDNDPVTTFLAELKWRWRTSST